MKAVFVYGVREIVLGILVAAGLLLMFYGYVEYQVKEWSRKRREKLLEKLANQAGSSDEK